MKTKRHNVFISHSSKNSEEVKALKERLLAMGHEVRNSSIEKKTIGITRLRMKQ